jgi:hypothetical protein
MPHLFKFQTFSPLFQGDTMIVIHITGIKEWRNAMFECHQWRSDWEQLMT